MTKLLLMTERQLQFEDVQFAFGTNFAGLKRGRFDREGERYFNIKIQSQEEADRLIDAGFNVKFYDAQVANAKRDEPLDIDMLEDFWYMKVPVYTQFQPPVIEIRDVTDIPELDETVHSDDRTFLPEELFGTVDEMEMDNVDLILTYRQPHPDGKYNRPQLKHCFIDVVSSPLERKHRY